MHAQKCVKINKIWKTRYVAVTFNFASKFLLVNVLRLFVVARGNFPTKLLQTVRIFFFKVRIIDPFSTEHHVSLYIIRRDFSFPRMESTKGAYVGKMLE